jgi:hypothetical protein
MESSIDNAVNGIYSEEGVAEQELRLGLLTRNVPRVRAKFAYHMSHEFGTSRTEIFRQLGYVFRRLLKPFRTWKKPRISVNFQLRPCSSGRRWGSVSALFIKLYEITTPKNPIIQGSILKK